MKWLGIGTGRCGTKSLARWGGAKHESVRLAWKPDRGTLSVVVGRMINPAPEVSFCFTRHWRACRAMDPDLPIICLHRDKAETVRSHLRICQGRSRCMPGEMENCRFSLAYPLFQTDDPAHAWALYWERVEDELAQVTAPVWHMDTYDLNDPEKMAALETWLKEQDRWVS